MNVKQSKPILIFPYHDPIGKYNEIFVKNINLLKDIFDGICLSATFQTEQQNTSFLQKLKDEGFYIFKNTDNSVIGDHFRNALYLAKEKFPDQRYYYGFIDRILFALETDYRETFIKDILEYYDVDMIVFSRSEFAWSTHPKDYKEIENLINITGKIFFNKEYDWMWCGALLNEDSLELILKFSKAESMAVIAEMLFINLKYNKKIKNYFVDWLEWEDPFWNTVKNKNTMFSDKEKKFRLDYCLNTLKLFLD